MLRIKTLDFRKGLGEEYAFMPRPVTFLHVVRTARELQGISQKEMARRAGKAAITLNKFENGQADISRTKLVRICAELVLSYQQALSNEDPRNPRFAETETLLNEFLQTTKGQVVSFHVNREIEALTVLIKQLFRIGREKKKLLWLTYSIHDALNQIKAELEGGKSLKRLPPKKGRPPKLEKSPNKPRHRSAY